MTSRTREQTPAQTRATWRPRRFTLDVYIGRRFLGLLFANLLVFTLTYVLIDSLSQVDHFLEASTTFVEFIQVAFTFYYYQIPELYCRLLGPIITMTSGMFAVTVTLRSNELVPILATGTSVQRTFAPILVLSTILAGTSMWIQEDWIPSNRDAIRHAASFGKSHGDVPMAHYTSREEGLTVLVENYSPAKQIAEGVWILRQGADGGRVIYTSRTMEWVEWDGAQPDGGSGAWRLTDGEVERWGPDGLIIPVEARLDDSMDAGSSLTRVFSVHVLDDTNLIPQDLEGAESKDLHLSLSEIERKIDNSPSRSRWQIKYYARFVDPLNHLILLLLGLPILLLRDTRNVFLSALLAVFIATAYFVSYTMATYLGDRRILDPVTAVWLVPILFASLGFTMYCRSRT